MEKQELKPQKLEVRYLKDDERIRSRELYEEVFVEDADGFSELYYKISRDNRILVAENDGAIVSMLHRNPYTFRFRGASVPAGLYRSGGYQSDLPPSGTDACIAHKGPAGYVRRRSPLHLSVPADEAIYTPFDFRLHGNETRRAWRPRAAKNWRRTTNCS